MTDRSSAPADDRPLSDALAACARGEPEGMARLARLRLGRLVATAAAFVDEADEAETVGLDALTMAWRNAWRLDPGRQAPDPWLFAILGSRLHSQLTASEPAHLEAAFPPPHRPPAHLSGPRLATLSGTLPEAPSSERLQRGLEARLATAGAQATAPLTATGERVHPDLYDRALAGRMRRSRLAFRAKAGFKRRLGRPLEDWLFRRWLAQAPPADWVEAQGLPRRSVEAWLGERLSVWVDPRTIRRGLSYPRSFPARAERRKVSSLFLWSGDWDLPLTPLLEGGRFPFIRDLWRHRRDPTASDTYHELLAGLERGAPLRSHHKGILVDSPGRARTFMDLYLGYMEDMACFGFDTRLSHEGMGVAIGREGGIIKVNKGLHRLAMAQVLGLPRVPVQVRGVHRGWWQAKTAGTRGAAALARLPEALQDCRPAP